MTSAVLRYELDRVTGPHNGEGMVHGRLWQARGHGACVSTQAPVPICIGCPRKGKTCDGMRLGGDPAGYLVTVPKNGIVATAIFRGTPPQGTTCLEEQTVKMTQGTLSSL